VSVHRTRPLPEAGASGQLIVAESVARRTRDMLQRSGLGAPAREALVWWLGRRAGDDTVVLACHQPPCHSGPQFVMVAEAATGNAARAARALRLSLVAQVHSHPGSDTRHSDGDDGLVLMPFPGMFSLVVANYGSGSLLPEHGAGLHQFRDGRWVIIRQPDPVLIVVPSEATP
jgi:proteasome lid subunit RPN8/RPN11